MKIEVGEEITEEEYKKLPLGEGIIVNNFYGDLTRFFKKAQQFPICFEDKWRKYTIEEKTFRVYDKVNEISMSFQINSAFPLLVKAVEKAKEVAKKNEN